MENSAMQPEAELSCIWTKEEPQNPHKSLDHKYWKKIFIASCLCALLVDPLFLYVPILKDDIKCLMLDQKLKITVLILRSITDFFYLVDIIIRIYRHENNSSGLIKELNDSQNQMKCSFVWKSRMPRIAKTTWMSRDILIDIVAVLPFPQVAILIFFSKMSDLRSLTTTRMVIMNVFVLLQYLPRVLRIYVISVKKFKTTLKEGITETPIWIKGVLNFSMYIIASHVFGAVWYFFAIQRMMICWHSACRKDDGCDHRIFSCHDHYAFRNTTILDDLCPVTVSVSPSDIMPFDFGIFATVLQSGVVGSTNYFQKFLTCFWWGLRNLSSLGSNLQPSIDGWETLYTVMISIIGLLMFLYLIGNLQMYMQFKTTRKEDHKHRKQMRRKMKEKGREIELWLFKNGIATRSNKAMKSQFMEKVQEALEEYMDTNLDNILPNIPSDVQRRIEDSMPLAKLKQAQMLQGMDEAVLKMICQKLEPVRYTENNIIIQRDQPLENMLFIVDGNVLIEKGSDDSKRGAGELCGEELLRWPFSTSFPHTKPLAPESVNATSVVEALALKAGDLESIYNQSIASWDKLKEISSVSYTVPVEDISAIASDEYMAFESRISMVKDIITELKKPDINRIGVYGLGGVGKTTLAKEVYREAVKEKLFDDVVIILNVKEKKDNEKIQNAITKKLGVDVDESEDMGTRANLLRARIKDGKTLVILDDVSERIDFEAMGLVGVPNCKLLLTSRERKVLFSDMRTQKEFPLGFLTEKESWSLFEKMAGNVVKDNRILKEATQLAKKCGGLPVLVVAVANALRDSSLEEWKNALRSFKRFDQEELNQKASLSLKSSYEQLEDQELKQLFLLCGVTAGWESYSISFSDLLKYSMGLGLIKNVETVEEARISLNVMVKKLKNSCLLLDRYDDDLVRMHELVRDVAVLIASDEQKAFSRAYGDEVKQWPTEDFLEKCTRMSLRSCKIPRLPEVPWECPELKLLVLDNDDIGHSQEIPSKFFEGMKELKVLDVTRFSLQSLPPSLQSLKHLHTLCLDQSELVDITLVGQLTNLKILSLLKSKIKELPKEIGQLTRLQLLDLTGCSELVMISPGVISSLTRLEDLRMGIKSFKQWEGEGPSSGGSNATISELNHLAELTALDIHVPDANLLPPNLFSDKLERYTILIGDCWEYPVTYGISSNMLKLKLARRNQFDQGIKLLVKKCEQLYLDGKESGNIISFLFDSDAVKQLKCLHVQNNDEVTYVINSISWSYSHNAFPNLESLFLEDLVRLESVCYGELEGEPFQKLKSLTLRNLPKLIGFSSKDKQLTTDTEADEIVLEDDVGGPPKLFSNEKVSMPNLTTLIVHQCDSLRFLFSSSMAKSIGQLKHLKISKCQALQAVYDTSSTTQLNGFECPNLTSVEIDSCDNLKNVFPASVAKDLKQLNKLKVVNCGLMEEIVANEEGPQTTYKEFGFPKVTYMMFDNLPQLRSFYPTLHVSNWPLLNFLMFMKCGGVEILPAEFSTYQDKLELGHPKPTKQPFFLIEKGKSFLNLEYLFLDENTEILYGPLPAELLRKLKGIGFATSHPKSDVFFENFQNIEGLYVFSAPWKELIVHDHQGSSSGEIHEVETLPRIKALSLSNMPELMHLGKENSQPGGPVFPNLEGLTVRKCGRLENLASTLISFRNLTTLTILDCHGLQYLLPYSVAKNLQQLRELDVKSCERMVEIVASNIDDPENENEITFSCLQDLKVSLLPSLQGFCTGNCIVKVPSLLSKNLIVEECQLIELKISPDGLIQSDPRPGRLQIAEETDDVRMLSDSKENDRDQTVNTSFTKTS